MELSFMHGLSSLFWSEESDTKVFKSAFVLPCMYSLLGCRIMQYISSGKILLYLWIERSLKESLFLIFVEL